MDSIDTDGDGWSDSQELQARTDPNNCDTDGDGYWDPKDANPLDPSIYTTETPATPAPSTPSEPTPPISPSPIPASTSKPIPTSEPTPPPEKPSPEPEPAPLPEPAPIPQEPSSEPEPDIIAYINLDYSWHLESNYTSVPTYITNQSEYSADVVLRIKSYDSGNVITYDESFTLKDISPRETFYKPFNVTGTDAANVDVIITDANVTTYPPISNRTDLVIINEIPIIVTQEETFNVDIMNVSESILGAYVKVRWYDSNGFLRGVGITSPLGSIDPEETKRCRWGALSMWPGYRYYVYLID